jgi:hypothetical protein
MNLLRPLDLDLESRPISRSRFPGGRRRLVALAVVPALSLIAACDSGYAETSAYCGAVEDAKPAFVALQSGDPETFDQAFATFHELAQDSPSELDADWKVLDGAIADVEVALEAAGLDFAALSAGELPEDIDPQELRALMDGLEALASADITAAANSIEEHAFEACDVELAAG